MEIPSRFERREFGYTPFEGGMIRHLAFKDEGEIRALLVKDVPRAVFYSVSYYQEPSFQMMEKGWLGADLAFDIDADDLAMSCRIEHDIWTCKNCGLQKIGIKPEKCPTCDSTKIDELNWSCETCIGGAKNEALKLMEILHSDLSLSNQEIRVYFSGSMGFHIAVESKVFEQLDQVGRNDIADHVAGLGLSPALLGIHKQSTFEEVYPRLPSAREGGWRGRLARHFAQKEFEDFREKDEEGREKIAHLYKKVGYSGFKKELDETAKKIGVAIDTSVTTDIHRIFRLPNTLHGETGLLKKRCDDLRSFDPFTDAVVLNGQPLEIFVELAPKFVVRGVTYGPFEQQKVKLPTEAAVFLLGRGVAKVA